MSSNIFIFYEYHIIDVLNIFVLYINEYLKNVHEINAYYIGINIFTGILECIFRTVVTHICIFL